MPYVSPDGRIGGRDGWSLATIPALFWGFIDFIVLFFRTLVNPEASRGNSHTSSSGSSGRRPPPGPPPRRMGRINHGGGPGPPPMMGGG